MDWKTGNIYIDEYFNVFLLDYGISVDLDRLEDKSGEMINNVLGTPHYISYKNTLYYIFSKKYESSPESLPSVKITK